MINKFGDFRDNVFQLKEYEGNSKVLDLAEAIRRHVKPGMKLHVSDRANALARELLRQFYGSKPNFTLITTLATEQVLNLIHCGLVKKVITSSCTEIYPTPAPSRIVQRAFKSKLIEIENWTLLTLAQRLMAGAFDLPFMPTKSLSGSSMAQENAGSFYEMPDPFGGGTKVGLVRALNPDISLIHAWAADPQGNIIVAPYTFSGEDTWGPKASNSGVVATVEHIVSTQFIREHSALVTIPGYMVNSVSLVPLGAHPQGMVTNFGISEFEPYIDDYEFIIQRRQASRNPEDLDSWIENWVLDCPDQNNYLSKLGDDRILFLRRKATADSWKDNPALDAISHSPGYNLREMMIVAAARRLEESVLNNGYKGILSGIGTSCLASYLAYYKLKQKNYDGELWIGSGYYGFSQRPANSTYPPYADVPTMLTCKMISDVVNTYGVFVGGKQGNCISVLSAAEVDKRGNLNSTMAPDSYIIGSGGSNDALNSKEVLLMVPQSRERLVNNVSYVTCPGNKVKVLVTDRGVFEKIDSEFVLTHFFSAPEFSSPQEAIDQIRQNCGWQLNISPQVTEVPAPSLEELLLLRTFDPQGYPESSSGLITSVSPV